MVGGAHRIWWFAGLALGLGGCDSSRLLLQSESAKNNTQTVLAFEETVFNKHRVRSAFEHYVDPDFIEHGADPLSRDAAEQALSRLLDGAPDAHQSVGRVVAQGDLVAVHKWWDPHPGRAPGVAVADFYRVENGRIVERWVVQQSPPAAP